VRVISKPKLIAFWQEHPSAKQALQTWYEDASQAQRVSSHDIKRRYASASFMAGNRVVFNIKGNDYRLITAIRYDLSIVFIRFVGTHPEYDRIDAATI